MRCDAPSVRGSWRKGSAHVARSHWRTRGTAQSAAAIRGANLGDHVRRRAWLPAAPARDVVDERGRWRLGARRRCRVRPSSLETWSGLAGMALAAAMNAMLAPFVPYWLTRLRWR